MARSAPRAPSISEEPPFSPFPSVGRLACWSGRTATPTGEVPGCAQARQVPAEWLGDLGFEVLLGLPAL